MKKKMLIGVLLVGFLYPVPTKPIGFLDLCAAWIAANCAYHISREWIQANSMRPTQEVIMQLKLCIKELKIKILEEQDEIKQCQHDLAQIIKELNLYKDRLNIAS